jgi:hypothetical protein
VNIAPFDISELSHGLTKRIEKRRHCHGGGRVQNADDCGG